MPGRKIRDESPLSGLYDTRPLDKPAFRKGVRSSDDLMGTCRWVVRDPAFTGPVATHVRQLISMADVYIGLPKKKASLDQYVMVMRWIRKHAEDALAEMKRGIRTGAHDELLRGDLEDVGDFARLKLDYYEQLRVLQRPSAALRVRDVVENHFKVLGGKSLVNMMGPDKQTEYFDPLHRQFGAAWKSFMAAELAKGGNPYEKLVEFLLGREDVENFYKYAQTYLSSSERATFQLIFQDPARGGASGDRLVYALYNVQAGHKTTRYEPHLDGQVPLARLDCRYLPYTTLGYRNPERESYDLEDGDLYAMDESYRLYSCNKGQIHSHLNAGEAVMAAGVLVAREGKILAIDNKSGHYRPTWKNLHQAVCELEFHGVLHEDAIVGLAAPSAVTMYFAKDEFIALGNQGFTYDATRAALVRARTTYRGGPPVPPSLVHLLPREDRSWLHPDPSTKTEPDRFSAFLKDAFPATTSAIFDALARIKAVPIPTVAQWKAESDAGLLARRHDLVLRIDDALASYHQALETADREILFDDRLDQALGRLHASLVTWLQAKDDKATSTRRPAIERLQTKVLVARLAVPGLRPTSAERMAMGSG